VHAGEYTADRLRELKQQTASHNAKVAAEVAAATGTTPPAAALKPPPSVPAEPQIKLTGRVAKTSMQF
jgi:hypothetical protein